MHCGYFVFCLKTIINCQNSVLNNETIVGVIFQPLKLLGLRLVLGLGLKLTMWEL